MTCKQCKYITACMAEVDSLGQVFDPNYDGEHRCTDFVPFTNADRIRAMNDEELAEFLTYINLTNCQDCAFSHGWRCQPQPDRDYYSDFEKCEKGRKKWLQQPFEGE